MVLDAVFRFKYMVSSQIQKGEGFFSPLVVQYCVFSCMFENYCTCAHQVGALGKQI